MSSCNPSDRSKRRITGEKESGSFDDPFGTSSAGCVVSAMSSWPGCDLLDRLNNLKRRFFEDSTSNAVCVVSGMLSCSLLDRLNKLKRRFLEEEENSVSDDSFGTFDAVCISSAMLACNPSDLFNDLKQRFIEEKESGMVVGDGAGC